MGQVLIRNLDDEVIQRLKAKAKQKGTSLEEFARQTLREASKPSQEEIWAEINRLREANGPVDWDSTKFIREQRDHGYSGDRRLRGDEVVSGRGRKRAGG